MTELRVEPKPVKKRAPEHVRDKRRKQELEYRLQRLVERWTQATTPNQAGNMSEAAAQQLYTELNLEWQELARKVNNGPEPIEVDSDAFTNAVDRILKHREAMQMAQMPLRQVPLMQYGFLKVHEDEQHSVWLSSLCALRVWKAEGAPVELYLAPPAPFLEHWANRLVERLDTGALYPNATDATLTLNALGLLGEVLKQGRPAQVSARVVELAANRTGYWKRLWNTMLNR